MIIKQAPVSRLTTKATLSPRMWLSIGEPKQEAKAI